MITDKDVLALMHDTASDIALIQSSILFIEKDENKLSKNQLEDIERIKKCQKRLYEHIDKFYLKHKKSEKT